MDKLNLLTPTIVLVVTTVINHVCKEKKSFSTSDFLVILSPTIPTIMPIIMSVIIDLYTQMMEFLKTTDIFVQLIYFLSQINLFLPKKCDAINNTSDTEYDNNDENQKTITLNCDIIFMQSLINYIIDEKNSVTFASDSNFLKFDITNSKTMNETHVWKNISIPFNNTRFSVQNITLTYSTNGTEILLSDFKLYENSKAIITEQANKCKDFVRFADFIENFDTKKYFVDFINKNEILVNLAKKTLPSLHSASFEFKMLMTLEKICPKLNKAQFLIDFIVVDEFYKKFGFGSYFKKRTTSKCASTSQIILFDYTLPYTISGEYSFTGEEVYVMKSIVDAVSGSVFDNYVNTVTNYINAHYNVLNSIKTGSASSTGSNSNSEKSNNSKTTINFYAQNINSDNFLDTVEQDFRALLKKVQNQTILKIEGSKIKIFNTKIERKEVVKTTENPEYKHYLDKKEMLGKMEKAEHTGMLMGEFFRCQVPDKEIIEKIWESSVMIKQINEKYKSLNTLYLREHDLRGLLTILTKFKNGTELFDEYGLPNKLGIMLHGLPGTGKTTTIHAIASFLQKNIYYVNLSTVETNEDLQLIFDHIVLQASGGGIIVFEDIDAMTTVVHQRKADNSHNMNAKLTLEYFLNLLQGSLTRDGTIFIATTNHLEVLDPAFYRIGRFDVKINMKKCDHYQIAMIYKKFIGLDIDPNVLIQIKIDEYSPAEIIFHLVNYISTDQSCDAIMKNFITHNV